jgi:hypothetical protein
MEFISTLSRRQDRNQSSEQMPVYVFLPIFTDTVPTPEPFTT